MPGCMEVSSGGRLGGETLGKGAEDYRAGGRPVKGGGPGARLGIRALDQATGALRWVMEREEAWFPPHATQPRGAGLLVPSLPEVISSWIDEEARLWVLLERSAASFRPLEDPRVDPGLLNLTTTFDSHTEVIDLGRREVVASSRFRWLRQVDGTAGLVHATETVEGGVTRFTAMEPKLAC